MRRHGQHPALGRQFVAELLGALAGDAFDQAAEVIGRWRGVTLYLPARGEEREQRVRELLMRVGVQHRAHALPSELSGGEMQRVAIARAVVHRPALILADEPTGNLDSHTGEVVLDLLAEVVRESQAAMLMVTHSEEAARRCDRVLRMKDGAIIVT